MEQQQDEIGSLEQAGERHEAAREWLAFLIDHPDKTVSVSEYKAQLKEAKKAVRFYEDRKRTADHVAKLVADAPPLTQSQIDRIYLLLHPDSPINPRSTFTPERPEVVALREAEANLAKVRKGFPEALAVCQGCNLAEKVHYFQKDYGTGFHDFVPLSPDDAIKVARSYKRKIAAAELALEKAQANCG